MRFFRQKELSTELIKFLNAEYAGVLEENTVSNIWKMYMNVLRRLQKQTLHRARKRT